MILMKDIISEGHESLTKIAKDVKMPLSKQDQKTLQLMLEYIKNSIDEEVCNRYGLRPSVGLAAPQINNLKRMLAVYSADERDEKLHSYMMVNPKIISHSEELTYLSTGEGCLSITREITGYVMRYKRITVETYLLKENGTLEKVKLRLKGYMAIVVQHEIDHLNGILFTERINPDNPFFVPKGTQPIVF